MRHGMHNWLHKSTVHLERRSFGPAGAVMKFLFAIIGLSVLPSPSLHSENWPHWRGPNFDGSSHEANLPTSFSRSENVKWTAAMPGTSAATPIVWGDAVFVSSADEKTK